MFHKKCCLERQAYFYLQITVLQFNRNPISIVQNPFKFTFRGFFPLRKIIFLEVGLFFIQWMLKINIPTSPFPLWEHIVRSKRDILFITLESFTNSILSKLRFSSLRKFMLCICKKNYFFGDANVKSQKGMILAGELQFYQLPIGISLLTPCCKRGNPTKVEMGATSIQHRPMLRLSITISRCNTLSVPKKNGERGTSWEQMWASRNNLCSRTNIQAFC